MNKKRKLIWQIFPSFLLITLLSLTAVTSYSNRYFKTFFLQYSEKELTIQTQLLEKKFGHILKARPDTGLEKLVALIDPLCKEIGLETGTRATVIMPDGLVVGDSFGDISTMENHASRPEIAKALGTIKGVSIRYSATLDNQMMYIALPVVKDDEVIAVVRTAVSISAIDQEIRTIRNRLILALVLTTLAAAVVSLYVTRRITFPIEQMKAGAARFAGGDLSTKLTTPSSEELSELSMTMNRMAESLDEKITDLKNRSMELEAVHSSMQEGVIAIDKNEKIITVNSAAARIFDFPSTDLKDRYILEVARNVEFQSFIQKALATHEPVQQDIVITRDDADRVLNIHSTALYESSKRRIGTLIIFHDITRIRRLESMHKQFAANVSHELKTPLTAIKGFIETLEGGLAQNSIEQNVYFIKIIDKNVNRMIELINDLLALSKLERMEGTRTRFEHQPLLSLIQSAVNTCQAGGSEKQAAVDIHCPEDLVVMVDPVLMEQAVLNLVDNAVKYSPEGSVVTVSAMADASQVHITIQDQGCGIGREHLPKIFNRFYRVDKARSRQAGGTGLGLAIVKHIVQYHQGSISVDSQKDKGSCFKISLPVSVLG